jgi:hypothetical protein
MSEPSMLTFIHRFSRSVMCEMRVVDAAPQPGEMLQFNHEWTGRPKPKHIAAYRQWTLYVTQMLTERWGKRILYGLGVSPSCTELWSFEPGSSPKLLEKARFGIP